VEILTAAEIKSASSELRRIIGYFTETDQLIDAAMDISIAHNHKRFTTASGAGAANEKPPGNSGSAHGLACNTNRDSHGVGGSGGVARPSTDIFSHALLKNFS
jgi:hypothetical protein